MSLLILCKTKKSYDRFRASFPKKDGWNVVLYNECSMCGIRAEHIILSDGDDWTDEEIKTVIMPYIVMPIDIGLRVKLKRYEEKLLKAGIPLEDSPDEIKKRVLGL